MEPMGPHGELLTHEGNREKIGATIDPLRPQGALWCPRDPWGPRGKVLDRFGGPLPAGSPRYRSSQKHGKHSQKTGIIILGL